MNRPRIVIAGVSSGSGKTSVSLAMMASLTRNGHRVQAFKVGPDYIDPSYHRAATGRPSHNLDSWLMDPKTLMWLFQTRSDGSELSIIEGVMGLYDGFGSLDDTASTAQIAKLLKAPVILVLDARGISRSAAAIVKGFQLFDRDVQFSGVILNQVASSRHFELLKEAIEHYTDVPVLGALFRDQRLKIEERHLGLLTASENKGISAHLDALTEFSEPRPSTPGSGFLLDKIIDIARQAPALKTVERPGQLPPKVNSESRLKIGIAQDRAFSFYYQANLDLLEDLGVELVPFSPVNDPGIPDCSALYFGGGFPEIYARELEENQRMRAQIRLAIGSGMPVYAECGGLMLLSESLETLDGKSYNMAGAIPGKIVMTQRLQNFGYKEGEMIGSTVLGSKGGRVRGHEFHYSQRTAGGGGDSAAYELKDRKSGNVRAEGYAKAGLLASYLHLHFLSNPGWAEEFVRSARNYSQRKEVAATAQA